MSKSKVLLILCTAMLLSACQPTPEENVVQSKNKDLVKEVVKANEEENREAMQEDKEIIEHQIEAINKHLNVEFQANDRVKIVVDADVSIPTYDKIPMVRVKPENLTEQHLKTLIEEVFGDNPVYFEGESYLSKEEIGEILLSLRAFNQNNELESHIKSHLEDLIDRMEERYPSAVNMGEEKLYDGTLSPAQNSRRDITHTSIKSYLGRTQAARIDMTQSENKTNNQMVLRNEDYGVAFNTFEPYEGIGADKIDMSYEECRQKAEELVKALDGENTNMKLYSSSIGYSIGFFADYTKETSPQCYSFGFAREYNGVLVKPVGIFSQGDDVNYAKLVSPESISITIDNEGIHSFYWSSYTKYLETLTEDVPLMDFESVNGIFEDYCRYKFSWVPRGDGVPKDMTVTINIDRIELNLMITLEKDNLESFIMIPVWDYIGNIDYDQPYVGQDGYTYDGPKGVSVLTVNAIDGTIIDREQGY